MKIPPMGGFGGRVRGGGEGGGGEERDREYIPFGSTGFFLVERWRLMEEGIGRGGENFLSSSCT